MAAKMVPRSKLIFGESGLLASRLCGAKRCVKNSLALSRLPVRPRDEASGGACGRALGDGARAPFWRALAVPIPLVILAWFELFGPPRQLRRDSRSRLPLLLWGTHQRTSRSLYVGYNLTRVTDARWHPVFLACGLSRGYTRTVDFGKTGICEGRHNGLWVGAVGRCGGGCRPESPSSTWSISRPSP